MANHTDRELGMHVPISRRDFLNGIAVGIGGASAAAWLPDLADAQLSAQSASYPPALTGLRGSHVGSFEVAHTLRDGSFWKQAGPPSDTGEVFDLVVVGGGISGLSAAHFFRARAGQSARILVLDNHDDFGGHAKRNEFHIRDRMLLMNGGTASINSPVPYSAEADGLLKTLGVNPEELSRKTTNRDVYRSQGLRRGMFFDRETFGADRLVVGVGQPDWSAYAARTPLSEQAQRDLVRLEEASVDYLPGLSSAEKKARLSKISYKNFLLTIVGVHPSVAAIYQARTHAEWGVGIEAESALDCWTHNLPGFQGMQLEDGSAPNMSYTAAGYADGGSYSYHFPDGNASIARLLVRSLVPDAVPGRTAEDVVTARVDYGKLDHSEASVRIRLNSTVVRVRHIGDPGSANEVEVTYAIGAQLKTVRGRGCVLACWITMIPYLCPELPQRQTEAQHYLVKVPLVYTSVALRNWESFQALGVGNVSSPGMYHSSMRLNQVVDIGDYKSSRSPQDPTLVHMTKTPCKPGLPAREQHKAGRMELVTTTFESFERRIREQFARTLQGSEFDAARDIEAITVNRWPHGYGYEYNPLFDPSWAENESPHIIGRQRFGRITIANTDSAATAYTDTAINMAYRAVNELLDAQ